MGSMRLATTLADRWIDGRVRGRSPRTVVLVALLALVPVACIGGGVLGGDDIPGSPSIVVPSGVTTAPSAGEVAQRALAAIRASEERLGYRLAPAEILHIQFLRPGEFYSFRKFDGSSPHGAGFQGPGWVVEATGTFLMDDRETGQITQRGTHGLYLWHDAVPETEGSGFYPCWTLYPWPVEDFEGSC